MTGIEPAYSAWEADVGDVRCFAVRVNARKVCVSLRRSDGLLSVGDAFVIT